MLHSTFNSGVESSSMSMILPISARLRNQFRRANSNRKQSERICSFITFRIPRSRSLLRSLFSPESCCKSIRLFLILLPIVFLCSLFLLQIYTETWLQIYLKLSDRFTLRNDSIPYQNYKSRGEPEDKKQLVAYKSKCFEGFRSPKSIRKDAKRIRN